MVAIVSGNSLGLNLTSLATLGQRGLLGSAGQGRSGEQAFVNVANGNLVLQDVDDVLVGRGPDLSAVRTYNSQGLLTDDNGDNWAVTGFGQKIALTSGTAGAAGSTVTRTDKDGSQAFYTWDTAKSLYVSSAGSGAFDTIAYNSGASQYVWTDGDSGRIERHQSTGTGRLVSVSDPSGNTITYAYNANGTIQKATNANGDISYYDYTGTNLTKIRTVSGTVTTTTVSYSYDTSNRLTTVTVDLSPADNATTDNKVYKTTYTYSGTSKRVASVTQSDGTKLSFTYVQVGSAYKIATVTDALGATTSFAYDTTLQTTTVTDALGAKSVYLYDAQGQLTQVRTGVTAANTSGLSQISYAYDADGNVSLVTDGEGNQVTLQYDAFGNLLREVDSAGDTRVRTYNAANQLFTDTVYADAAASRGAFSTAAALPETNRYIYAASTPTQLRFVVSAQGDVTEYRYNASGLRTSAIAYQSGAYAVGSLAQADVPTEAQMVSWQAAQDLTRSQVVETVYDARGEVTRTETYASVAANGAGDAASVATTQYIYDQRGLLLQKVAPGGGATTNVYDGLGRLLSASGPSLDGSTPNVTLTAYDDANGKTTLTLSNGLVTTSAYDKAGRLISVTQSSAGTGVLGTTSYAYDKDGNLLMTQDPTGVRTWMLYDEANRKIADIDATGALIEYVYNANGQLRETVAYSTPINTEALLDGAGKPTTAWSATNTTTSLQALRPAATDQDQKVWRFYDTANRLNWQVDALGYVTQTTYDGASRILSVTRLANPIDVSDLGNGADLQILLDSAAIGGVSMQSVQGTSALGDPVVLTAIVDGDSPGGMITFLNGEVVLGSAMVVNGQAYIETSELPLGTSSIRAAYSGDSLRPASTSAAIERKVTKAVVDVFQEDASAYASYGTASFSARVRSERPEIGNPTGQVAFYNGDNLLGTATIVNGLAVLSVAATTLGVGSGSIRAEYLGDGIHQAKESPLPLSFNVAPNPTTTSLQVSSAGGATVLNAAVSTTWGTSTVPTGVVTFYAGAAIVGTAPLIDGTATMSLLVPSSAGPFLAVYSGDASNAASDTRGPNGQPSLSATSSTLSASSTTGTQDDNIVLMVNVAGAGATGLVTFLSGKTVLGTATVTNGQATLTVNGLAVGQNVIQASYAGDGSNLTSATTQAITLSISAGTGAVAPLNSAGSVIPSFFAASAAPTGSPLGLIAPIQTWSYSRTAPDGTSILMSGTVSYFDGDRLIGSFAFPPTPNLSHNFGISGLSLGEHAISVVYSGNSTYASATIQPITVLIEPAGTAVQVAPVTVPTVAGAPLTLRATVDHAPAFSTTYAIGGSSDGKWSSAPSPTGMVTFYSGSQAIGSAAVVNGIAELTTSDLPIGTTFITATYSGDQYNAVSATAVYPGTAPSLLQTIRASTEVGWSSTELVVSNQWSEYGAPTTLTAKITLQNGSGQSSVASGDIVDFYDVRNSATWLGSAVALNGAATLTYAGLPLGQAKLIAVYRGNSDYGGGSSILIQNHEITKSATTITLAASAVEGTQDDTIELTAQFPGVDVTGAVTFFSGKTPLGIASVVNGYAILAVNQLAVGSHVIQATYSGDSNHVTGATDQGLTLQIVAGSGTAQPLNTTGSDTPFRFDISNGGGPELVGMPVDVSIDYGSFYSYPATGTFSFFENDRLIGSAVAANGQQHVPLYGLSVGTHSIAAVYSGDAHNAVVATTTEVTVEVQQASTVVVLSSAGSQTTFGAPLQLTARVAHAPSYSVVHRAISTAPQATGTVTFYANGVLLGSSSAIDGVATFSVSNLAFGSQKITASYSGDVSNAASLSNELTQEVSAQPASSWVRLSGSTSRAYFGEPVTLAAYVSNSSVVPTGTVTFFEGSRLLGEGTLIDGQATLTTTDLGVGFHADPATAIYAAYSGDANNMEAIGYRGVIEVARRKTVIGNLTATSVPKDGGVLSVKVDGINASGLVSFYNGTHLLGTAQVANGLAALSGVHLPPGTHTLTAAYSGDTNNADAEVKFSQVVTGTPETFVFATPDILVDRTVTKLYDRDGRLQGTLDAEGYLTEFTYNAAGELVQTIRYSERAADFESVSARLAAIAIARASYSLSGVRPWAGHADTHSFNFYDGRGQLVGQVDGEGYLTETTYDLRGNVIQITRHAEKATNVSPVNAASTLDSIRPAPNSAQDQTVVQTWSAANLLLTRTNAEGTVTAFSYDSVGQLIQRTTALGTTDARTAKYRYDVQGRLVGELDGRGSDAVNATSSLAVWADNGTTHTYDAAGRRASSTDANGNRTLFFHDAIGRLTYTVNALGEVTRSVYNALGQLTDQIAYGTRVNLASLSATPGGLASTAVANAIAAIADAAKDSHSARTYNATGTMASATDALNHTTTFSYNAFREAIASSHSLSSGYVVTDTASFDRRGLQTGATRDATSLALTERQTYDAFGRLVERFDANNNRTATDYDKRGRVVTTVDALNQSRVVTYDAFDRVLNQYDARGNATAYSYDTANRSVTVSTPEGVTMTSVRNRQGETQSVTDGRGNTTSYSYDKSGNLVQTSEPLATATSAVYDKTNRLIQTTDARGTPTTYTYDAANRMLTRTVDPAGLNLVTSYAYDAKGQAISVTDARGVVTTTEFDLAGQVTRHIVDPGGLSLQTIYAYDTTGQVLTVTDPNGHDTRYTYDGAGRRVMEQVDPQGLNLTRSYEYDANDNVTHVIDGIGNATRYAYDADNRLVFTIDPMGDVTRNTYDADGRLVRTVTYATPIDSGGLSAAPTLLDIEASVATSVSDITRSRRYDRDGRLSFVVDGTGAVVQYRYDAANNVIETRAYTNRIDMANWNVANDPPVVADGARDERVRTAFDALNRAAWKVDGTGSVVQSQYDANGNVTATRAYATTLSAADLASWDGQSAPPVVTDDARDLRTRAVFDHANRAIWTIDGAGDVVAYAYDKNGNLTKEIDYATPVAPAAAPETVVASATDRITDMAYDSANRRIVVVDAIGSVTATIYDNVGNVVARHALVNRIPAPTATSVLTEAQLGATVSPDWGGADRIDRFVYDAANREILRQEATGAVTQTQYDAASNMLWTVEYANPIDPGQLAGRWGVGFWEIMLLTSGSEADRATHYAHDAAGRVTYVIDPLGYVTKSSYNGTGRLVRTTAYANGTPPNTIPSEIARIEQVLVPSAEDRVTVMAYDAAGRRTFVVDPRGDVSRTVYDAFGNVTQQIDYANSLGTQGANATYTDAELQVRVNSVNNATVLEPGDSLMAGQSIYSFDGRYQLVLQFDGNVVVYDRQESAQAIWNLQSTGSGADRLEFQTDGNIVLYAGAQAVWNTGTTGQGRLLTFENDGNLVVLGSNNEVLVSTGVHDHSSAATPINGTDRIRRYAYDQANRQVFAVDALGGTTESVFDGVGREVETRSYAQAIQLQRLSTTASAADIRARVAADAANDRVVQRSFDAAGRMVFSVDALGYVSKIDYDAVGRTRSNTLYALPIPKSTANTLVGVSAAVVANTADRTTTQVFDAIGNVVSSTDAMGYTQTWNYNAFGDKLSYTNAKGSLWSYEYDRAGRMVRETSPQVELTAVAPDANGRLQVDAANSGAASLVTQMAYDAFGQLRSRTEAAGRPEQRTTGYEYDLGGHQVRVTYPPVSVYNAPGEDITTNGANSLAVRVESVQTLYTETTYDAFGDAVANRDVGGNYSYKAYDIGGNLVYDVDALGYVTGYTHNTFGEVTRLTRYGAVTTLAAGHPPSLSTAQVSATANALSHVSDRTLVTDYDRLGRAVQVTEPDAMVYDSSLGSTSQYFTGEKTTRNVYDTFGDLVQVGQLKSADNWALTNYYYDQRGQQVASVDALGYVTKQGFDAAGNVIDRVEFSSGFRGWAGTSAMAGWTGAVNAGARGVAPTVLSYPDDRHTTIAYDRLNRKTSETRVDVEYSAASDGTSIRGNLTTSYGYDAVGNLTVTTDATGAHTTSYYDALGRVSAVAEPTRAGADSANSVTPLTVFRRDAYGNVVAKTEYANGADASGNPLAVAGLPATILHPNPQVAALTGSGWQVEGSIGFVSAVQFPGSIAIYRMVGNGPPAGYFHMLASEGELAGLAGWTNEGLVGYIAPDGAPGTKPLYRLSLLTIVGLEHLCTTDLAEATSLQNAGWHLDGSMGGIKDSSDGDFDIPLVRLLGPLVDHLYVAGAIKGMPDANVDADLFAATDRTSFAQYDSHGHLVQSTDATGVNHYSSYNELGLIAKEWQAVTDNDGATRTLFRAYGYDAMGRQTHVYGPGTSTDSGNYTDDAAAVQGVYTPVPSAELITANDPRTLRGLNGPVTGWVQVQPANVINLQGGSVKVQVTYFTPESQVFDENGVATTQPGHEVVMEQQYTAAEAAGGVVLQPAESIESVSLLSVLQQDGAGNWVTVWQGTPAQANGASGLATGADVAGKVDTALTYNGFGELISRSVNGQAGEYFDYDNAGRLWRTNAGDGIDKVALYDLQGRQTADIRSAGQGRADLNLRAYASADAVAGLLDVRRTDTTYDVLGRVVKQALPERLETQGGVVAHSGRLTVGTTTSAGPGSDPRGAPLAWAGINSVSLDWTNYLADLGSGDVRVTLNYISKDGSGAEGPGTSHAQVFAAAQATSGVTVSWAEPSQSAANGGISRVTHVLVEKKDQFGQWQTMINRDGSGFVGHGVHIAAPGTPVGPPPGAQVTMEVRPAGSAGDGGWVNAPLANFGDDLRYDASALAVGNHEYRVWTTLPGGDASVTATGTLSVSPRLLDPINTPTGLNAGAQTLEWQGPGGDDVQVIRMRLASTDDAWIEQPIGHPNGDAWSTISLGGMAGGTYEYELLWRHPGEPGPYAHATGQFTKVPGTGDVWVPGTGDVWVPGIDPVPASGSPPLAGVQIEMVEAVVGYDDASGQPQLGMVPAIHLPLPPGNAPFYAFSLRVPGSPYAQVQLMSRVYVADNAQHILVRELNLLGATPLPAGTYEITYLFATAPAGPPPSNMFVGLLTINADGSVGLADTTPAYNPGSPGTPGYTIPGTPGYTIPGTPPQYGWTATQPGPYAQSQGPAPGEATQLSIGTGLNGVSGYQRPVVIQNVDRWGNVIGISDPRSANWVTTYSYNANNQVVTQIQPDGVNIPVTRIYYDALGRQVAVRDANDHVNGSVYDAGGNLVTELHADGGTVSHAYDAFGNKVRTIDAVGNGTWYLHDKLDRLLRTTHGAAEIWGWTGAALEILPSSRGFAQISETQRYDQAGRLLSQTNGAGETVRYAYDLRGNLIATTQPLGQVTRAAYDALNRKVLEVDANGALATWRYSYFGQLTGHTDIGGASYGYTYDNAHQLVRLASTRGQDQRFAYDAAGQLARIDDLAIGQSSTYRYDLAGRRIRETTVQGGITFQDNFIAYDRLGRMRWVSDGRVLVNVDYDRVGNRTHVGIHLPPDGPDGVAEESERYYQYDAMNRQTVVDAVDEAGTIEDGHGHLLTYDLAGNRKSDTSIGARVFDTGSAEAPSWTPGRGLSTETYTYDALNRLTATVRDGRAVDTRGYDAASRVLQSGSDAAIDSAYAMPYLQANGSALQLRASHYDAAGQLVSQSQSELVMNNTTIGMRKSDVTYRHDAAGNVLGYDSATAQFGSANTLSGSRTVNTVERAEGYRQATSFTTPAGPNSGVVGGGIGYGYDANGHLVYTGVVANNTVTRNHSFVNDANGTALFAYYGDAANPTYGQRQLVVNGEVLGRYGMTPNERIAGWTIPVPGADPYIPESSFSFGYQPINGNYPAGSPGTYAVGQGDTLQSIAKGAYGDSNLWYLIAEANGLGGNADLRAGQVLTIPTSVSSANNVDTFKPYDPSRIMGDTSATMMAAPAGEGGGCGAVGQIIVVIVAIVVTIYTAGAAAGAWGAVGTAGTATASAGIGATMTTGLTALGGGYGAIGVAAAVAGGALGSIVSQGVGIAIGAQDEFSWKGVALSAIGAGVGAGLGAGGLAGAVEKATGSVVAGRIATATVGSTLTQGIAVATGLQDKFSWKSVAASAVSAGVGQGLNSAMGYNPADGFDFGKSLVSGVASSIVGQAVRGGKVNATTLASDAFGNIVGDSLAWENSSNNPSSSRYENQMDRGVLTFGNALGESLSGAMTSGGSNQGTTIFDEPTDWGRAPAGAGYGYQGSANGITNWQANEAAQAAADDDLLYGLNSRNGSDVMDDTTDASGRRAITVGRGQGILSALGGAGLSAAEQRAAYGQLARYGQLTAANFDAKGMPVTQAGQDLYVDLNDLNVGDATLGGALIANESSNRATLQRIAQERAAQAATAANTGASAGAYADNMDPRDIRNSFSYQSRLARGLSDAQALADFDARIANGPTLRGWDPRTDGVREADNRALANFLNGQGSMALGGVASATAMISSGNVQTASMVSDLAAPIDGLIAPMGGGGRTALASGVRGGGLNPTAAERAAELQRLASAAERSVTPALQSMAEADGGQMLGLEYRLKTADSLMRKIANNPTDTINDALRYTMSFDDANFTSGVKNAMDSLQAQGYQQTALSNTFKPGRSYMGINSTYLTPEGQMFELQFHTQDSFQMKDVVNHPLYEQQRVLPRNDPTWSALQQQMIRNSSAVPIPPGVSSIKGTR